MACLLRCKSVDWSISSIIAVCLIGLVGGCLGGMLGLGGSVFIIPALSLALGPNQHLYQAAALTANIFVAVAANSCERSENSSIAVREMPYRAAMSSAEIP